MRYTVVHCILFRVTSCDIMPIIMSAWTTASSVMLYLLDGFQITPEGVMEGMSHAEAQEAPYI